ncbi:MAG: hypothetical protein JO171_03985 [Paludibacterium sp.]|uniref:hypothetical protein n=1 Tax=Paludibacterium sp. TaxID=1917523 RepID=UPI0025D8D79C|nr:hypothetical protein [Paludibacterium sp.]MBV8046284.1 hypothetical protein [Paludibacterium sp.]MBV8648047.1 hypothetical protein [Paludibacterium sp.]
MKRKVALFSSSVKGFSRLLDDGSVVNDPKADCGKVADLFRAIGFEVVTVFDLIAQLTSRAVPLTAMNDSAKIAIRDIGSGQVADIPV